MAKLDAFKVGEKVHVISDPLVSRPPFDGIITDNYGDYMIVVDLKTHEAWAVFEGEATLLPVI